MALALVSGPVPEVRIDVSSAVPFGEPAHMSAHLHRPDGPPVAVLVCWPGGSYGKTYWEFPAAGYDFSAYMTARGYLVVTADHLGVGQSTKPADGDVLDLTAMAQAQAAFVVSLRQRLATGTLVPDLEPLNGLAVIGIGHSMGGGLAVIAQAMSGCYDAVADLGYTHGSKDAATAHQLDSTGVGADVAAAREIAVGQARIFFGDTWDDVYGTINRPDHHGWLHGPDVPADLIALDDTFDEAWPRESYVQALTPGSTVGYAAGVTCPVFVGFGEHDVPPLPRDDVAFYTGSNDVTLFVLAGSYHCHTFAARRTELWDRLDAWARGLAISAGGSRFA